MWLYCIFIICSCRLEDRSKQLLMKIFDELLNPARDDTKYAHKEFGDRKFLLEYLESE